MKIPFVLILTLLILSGCASPTGQWIKKTNQTHEEYWTDRDDCQRFASAQIALSAKGQKGIKGWGQSFIIHEGYGDSLEKFYFNKCMEEKGYKWEIDPNSRNWNEFVKKAKEAGKEYKDK
jgi:hypothetical protein